MEIDVETSVTTWTDDATSLLIEARRERRMKTTQGKFNQQQWKQVAHIVNQTNYFKTPITFIQCNARIANLKRKYKLEHSKVIAGCEPSNWPFYEQMDRLIGLSACKAVPVEIPPLSPTRLQLLLQQQKLMMNGFSYPIINQTNASVGNVGDFGGRRQPLIWQQQNDITARNVGNCSGRQPPLICQQQNDSTARNAGNCSGRQPPLIWQQQNDIIACNVGNVGNSNPIWEHQRFNSQSVNSIGGGFGVGNVGSINSISVGNSSGRQRVQPVTVVDLGSDSEDSLPSKCESRKRVREEVNVGGSGMKKGKGINVREDSMSVLTRAMAKFMEVYEVVEYEKLDLFVEMEKKRMKVIREMELERMKFLMTTQLELEKLKRGGRRVHGGGGGGGEKGNHVHH